MQKHLDGDESAMERGENTRQLDVSYRSLDATAPLTTGDRAPDSPLLDADGNKLRLFDLFRGPHETLLRFNPSTATSHPHAVTVVREPEPGAYTSPDAYSFYYAKDGDEFLIRPDGYLG